jgi:hypothetical protein
MANKKQRLVAAAAALLALLVSGCGGAGSSTPPSNITVMVMPSMANVVTGASQPFTAAVMGTTNTNVTWEVNGAVGGNSTVGTITAAGVYTAPPTPPASANPPVTVMVTAVSQADATKSNSATVTILPNNQQAQTAPIHLGTSGGDNLDLTQSGNHVTCCSGTLGSLVARGGTQFILSNNHVLARSDQAKPPEPIGQPGLADVQCQAASTTVVANLTQFAPLKTSNVDAAIAAVVAGQVDPSGTILDLGTLSGTSLTAAPPANTVIAPAINLPVAKSGSRTGLTCSTIMAINANVQVQYSTTCGGGTTFNVNFSNDQVVINSGTFSAAGDSGSLVVDSQTAQPVGLLYAGSSTNTVANPINDVLNALKDPATMAVPTIVGGAQYAISCPAGAVAQPQAAQAAASLPEEKVAAATAAKENHVQQLMADPAVLGVGVGASEDASGEPAVIIFVDKNAQHAPIPAQLDGIRTKVILTDRFHALSGTTPQTNQPAQAAPIAQAEVTRVTVVKEKYAQQMMADPAIIGVGVGASMDNPGEAAMVVFVDKNKQPSSAIPVQMDNVRTRIILTEPFRTFGWNEHPSNTCAGTPAVRVKR